jgi:hypothetical protein
MRSPACRQETIGFKRGKARQRRKKSDLDRVKRNPSERWAYRFDQSDSDGSYHLATIPAGDYFLIALTDGSYVLYRDAKVAATLARAGKPLHIEPGDHLNLKVDVVNTASLNLPSP